MKKIKSAVSSDSIFKDREKEAKAKGLGPTQLIRMWIMEKVGIT